MRMKWLIACPCLALLATPLTASAQGGVPGGAAHGSTGPHFGPSGGFVSISWRRGATLGL